MQRDGTTQSVWQPDMTQYEPHNSWSRNEVYPVLIVGGGITGLTTALLLQERGVSCILAEAHNLGFGTTGGTTAHLNTILDTSYDIIEDDFGKDGAELTAASCREAIDLVEGLVEKYGIDCGFSYQSGYLLAEDRKELEQLEKIVAASERAGVVVSWADKAPAPMPHIKAARFEFQAQLHATRYLQGLARAFESLGGVILQHCMVQGIEDKEPFEVSTTLGEIRAERIVYATHLPPGINLLHFRCAPYRSYAAAFTVADDNYPDGLVYDLKDPYHYIRCQEAGGKRFIVLGGFDHKAGHEENTEQVFREMEAYIREHYSVATYDYQWSSQYYNSADGLPYIGKLPGYDKIYVGTGYGGNGITLGSLAGKMLSDALTDTENRYEELLRPGRIKPVAGFMDFIKENADVVSQFIGKRFAYEQVTSLAELAPGEAKLADWNGKKVGLYKDEEGKVQAVDPVCPHAKCIVAWNNAEKSWDCPCHGGRYAPNGDWLTGPAKKGLAPLLWQNWDGD